MPDLHLIEGPAGSGKSAFAAELKRAGAIDILADLTRLWAAIGLYERTLDGGFPIRRDDDPALEAARYIRVALVSFALGAGLNVAVTVSQRDQVERWREIATRATATFQVTTIDPGERVVRARLANPVTEVVSSECEQAIARWYG